MLQHLLDDHAQTNAICHINPITKLTLGLGSLLLVIISPSPVIPVFTSIILSGVIIGIARIPAGIYTRLLLIPAGFTLISVAAIMLLTGGEPVYWQTAFTPWLMVSISGEGVRQGVLILARVLGGTISLLLIALTIPFTDIIQIMNRCRVPQELIDLITILYRNIFILLDQAVQIHSAQVMRLGYSRLHEATESFGMLCGSLFITSWNAGEDLIRAMDCRCYDGKFAPLISHEPVKAGSAIPVLVYLAFLTALTLVLTCKEPSGWLI